MMALLSALLLLFPIPHLTAEDGRARPNTLTSQEVADGWILLFDGKTTSGWHAPGGSKWAIYKGMLAPEAGKPGLLVTDARFRQFQMKLQYFAWTGDLFRPRPDPSQPRILLGCKADGRPAAGGGFRLPIDDGTLGLLMGGSLPGPFDNTGWVDMTITVMDRGDRYRVQWFNYRGREFMGSGNCETEGRAGDGHIALAGNGFIVRNIRIVELHRPPK